MVSAFRGLNEIVQSRQGSGLVMDWKQSGGSLLVGGDSRVIKVWDASTEQQGLVRLFSVLFLKCHSWYVRIWIPTPTALLLLLRTMLDPRKRLWQASLMA